MYTIKEKNIPNHINPWPKKKRMKFGSGKVNLISGCVLAINPPAMPQKNDISKKIFFLESKKMAAQIADKWQKWRGNIFSIEK